MLRRTLRARLPDFNIPSEFVFLDAMPTTPLGKTDRIALRAVAAKTRPPVAAPPLQASGIESDIVAIWAQILDRADIGVDQDFFELGGDSLMVMQVAPAIQRRFEIELPLAVLFERPTVRALAAYVRQVSPITQPVTSSRS